MKKWNEPVQGHQKERKRGKKKGIFKKKSNHYSPGRSKLELKYNVHWKRRKYFGMKRKEGKMITE